MGEGEKAIRAKQINFNCDAIRRGGDSAEGPGCDSGARSVELDGYRGEQRGGPVALSDEIPATERSDTVSAAGNQVD